MIKTTTIEKILVSISNRWKRRGRFSEFVGKRVQTFKTKGNLQWECL